MATATREKLRQMVEDLPETEIDAAEEALQRLFDACRRRALDKRLLDEGLLVSIPPPPTEETIRRFREWKPIKIEGEPLSETIIRERR